MGVGYFFVWAVFGVFAFVLGAALAAMEMGQPPLARAVPIATGVVAIITGALQFTAWKARYLACCRSAFARTDVGASYGETWRHGLRIGLSCSYCCAGLMAILLALGVMDLRAMAVVTAAITAERLAPAGCASRARSGRLSWPPGWFWWRAPFDEILALHQLLECEVHVDHRPGQRCAAIFHVGQQFFLREDRELRFQVSRNLLGASLPHPRSRGFEQRPIELRVFTESGPGVDVTVPFNHGVDVGNSLERLLERVGQRDHAAAGHRVDEGRHLPGKDVAGGHGPERREHDERVAVRVAGTEVIEIDSILPLPSVSLSVNVLVGITAGLDATRGFASIHFFVFSCVTFSTDAGK